MNTEHAILARYTAAEEDERLGLFLMHRHLREAFLQIDLAEPLKPVSETTGTVGRCFGTLHQCCLGWLRL